MPEPLSLGQRARKSLAELYSDLWENDSSIPNVFSFLGDHQQATPEERSGVLLVDQARRARLKIALPCERYLARFPEIASDRELELKLIEHEFKLREDQSERPEIDVFVARFPELRETLLERLQDDQRTRPDLSALRWTEADDAGSDDAEEVPGSSEWERVFGAIPTPQDEPRCFGRYRVERLLDDGGFGEVYLAHDDRLERLVAVKVPHSHLVSEPKDVESYLIEAQIVARLDHPGIIPVYDFGPTDDGRCYLVEKYVRGSNLAIRLTQRRSSHAEAAALVATVAEALHFVHTHGLVHRDVKPANILVDMSGGPVLTDFGLALKEEDFGKRERLGGTVAYMSPKQARNEGHLVDGRSDIFSLGVVFYEMLAGVLPFQGRDREQTLEFIQTLEARPPRMIDDSIPRELERVCLKALSKRSTDRYTTALDMSEDLRHYLAPSEATQPRPAPEPIRVPGLRPFEKEDAGFFWDLLPGPRGRDGMPDSIRFWKTRIEETDADRTFRVGLLYGASGCGKSSLVKAGLLPQLQLAGHVVSVFVEATPADTEKRLLKGLRKSCPNLGGEPGLSEALAAVRMGRAGPPGKKLLLVVDQFEQWLHGRPDLQSMELVRSLRQCDGRRLQCLVMVRDDFWMAVTGFLRELDTRLVEGENSLAVDLFDLRHARKVLTTFGRTFGALPKSPRKLTKSQSSFVDRAVLSLAIEGKVIPVRLALFAEMFKGKAWYPTSLKEVGGAEGVGVRFLDETFTSLNSPLQNRPHREAATAILRALLPEPGTDIKGHMCSRSDLLEASGPKYISGSRDFEGVMRILDSGVRLLTPVDPEAVEEGDHPKPKTEKHYQLTHDYLVPPLREWLTRENKKTRRGRARLKLEERYALWRARREQRQLPSSWEWLKIRVFTRSKRWSPGQTRMMRLAGRFIVVRGLVLATIVVLTALFFKEDVESGLRAWWRDQTVRSLINRSRDAWGEGHERWVESCQLLEKAHLEKPEHPAAQKFLAEIFTRGALTIHTEPDDLAMEVLPDPEADRALGLNWSPRIPEGGPRFGSGERIALRVGHYRVSVKMNEVSVDFPIFIGHVRYEKTPEGEGWEPRWLTHRESATFNPFQQGHSSSFTFAENVVIKRLVLPEKVPDDFAYVNPGPFWRAPSPTKLKKGKAPPVLGGDVGSYDGSTSLIHDELPNGFLIAQDETTIGDFRRWFDRFGADVCRWLVETYSRVPEAKHETRIVPLEIHKECWREELEKRGYDADDFKSSDAILDLLLADQLEWWNDLWDPIRRNLADKLAKENDLGLPVSGVHQVLAEAYVRTNYLRIEPGDFKRWLEQKIDEAERYVAGLEHVQGIVEQQAGDSVDPHTVPDSPLVRFHWGRKESTPRPPVDAYVYWLEVRTYYGWQLPLVRIKTWARRHLQHWEGVRRIDTILYPSRWLWTLWTKGRKDFATVRVSEPELRKLIDAYVGAIARGDEYPEKAHFTEWLEWMIEQEKQVKETFEGLLVRLDGPEEKVKRELENLPFRIRHQYGAYRGWNLATDAQWEKACRGADARTYPWGDHQDELAAWISRPGGEGLLAVDTARLTLRDRSPHDVYCMAGNVSEWILVAAGGIEFLKGSNYRGSLHLADAGHFLSLIPVGQHEPWAGFRVVRELLENGAGKFVEKRTAPGVGSSKFGN